MAPACGNSPDRYGPLADLLTYATDIRRALPRDHGINLRTSNQMITNKL